MTTKVTNIYNLKLTPSQFGQSSLVVSCSQYDSLFRVIQFNLFNGNSIYSIPEGSVVTIRGTKKDNTGFEYECDYSNNVVTFPLQQQITIFPGKVPAELRITSNGEIIGSWNFLFLVEESPLTNDTIISETDLPLLESALQASAEAENYKNLAQVSADNALQSAETASESEANALTYSQNAQTSANSASQSEANALTYSQNASESATEAQGFAQDAEDSATQAQGYATSASQSATTAQQIADNIADLVDDAQGYASQSSQSASQAQGYATQASQSATNASQSASNAQTYASNANQSAQNASNSATSAQTYAGNASTSATQSASSATQSAQSATNAQTYASNASTSATQAQGYATNASNSATASADSATESQGYAQNASDSASEAQELVDTVEERIKNKADIDGVYPKLVAGDLIESETKDDVFTYQVTDHTGVANINSIKGNTLVWNQLCRPAYQSSATISGITFTNNLDGSWTLNGTASADVGKPIDNFTSRYVTGHKILFGSSSFKSNEYGVFPNAYVANLDTPFKIVAYAFNPVICVQEGVTVNNVVIKPQIFDLTQMFGAGNEPTTVDEFTALFPLPYYAYESGKLLSFNGTGIKVTNEDSSIEETLSLPIAQHFPTGMKRALNAYDELTESKASTRIKQIKVTSCAGNSTRQNGDFYGSVYTGVSLVNDAKPTDNSETGNVICNVCGTMSASARYASTESAICVRSTGIIELCIAGITTQADMNTYLANNDVYIAFELATPTEEDVDLDLSYNTYKGGTEQLLPVNTDVPVTSPISMNVEFDFGENLNARFTKVLNMIAPVESAQVSKAYTAGQYLIYDYTLYKVTSNIASGGTITVGTNVMATTLASILESL